MSYASMNQLHIPILPSVIQTSFQFSLLKGADTDVEKHAISRIVVSHTAYWGTSCITVKWLECKCTCRGDQRTRGRSEGKGEGADPPWPGSQP